jgi:8-oxo-dGTP diphosphatase/2-hydroxy-dATP diphosphatase
MDTIKATLSFVKKGEQVLLGFKKRGFGKGKWNGFGGKVLPQESIARAARREFTEETGLLPLHQERVALLVFEYTTTRKRVVVHVFHVVPHDTRAQETEEIRPQWFYQKEVPYQHMWADDIYWLPQCLEGAKIKGYFRYADEQKILWHYLEEAHEL